jgi:selenocysteine-specific translation elongation factor
MVSVNGVVLSGSVKKYDKTVLMPWGKEFIVQDVLVEGLPVGQAKIGDRVTILYKGLYYHDVQIGDVSSVEGVFHKGKKLKFELHINAFFKDDIRPDMEVQLNVGLQTLPVTITRITKDNAEVGRATTNEKVEVEVESKLPFAFEKGQQCIVYNPEAHWRSIKIVGAGTMKEGA